MRAIIYYLFLVIFFSCITKDEPSFLLEGKTIGLENGTKLYLQDNLLNKIVDSTVIKDNKFRFTTTIENFPARCLIKTKDFSHWRDLWLEEGRMFFDATKGNFSEAIVTGSKSEDLVQKLKVSTKGLSFEQRNNLEKEFVKNNTNSVVSAFILSVFSRDWGRDFTKKWFDKFSEEVKNSDYGNKISKFLSLNRNITIGSDYVDIEMTDDKGSLIKLSESLGEITLLEFWSSWCSPCRKENPNLVQTYKVYKPKGFEIYAVSLDTDEDKWIKAIASDRLIWPNVSDLKGFENIASLVYGVYAIPDNFLIDQNGKIVARNIRGNELNEKIAELLD